MQTQDAETRLQNLTWLITAASGFILVFVISMTALMLWQAYRLGNTASEVKSTTVQTHEALCALRADIQVRHDNTVEYLRVHKDAYILGVSRETFEKSLRDQESTLSALDVLDCQ